MTITKAVDEDGNEMRDAFNHNISYYKGSDGEFYYERGGKFYQMEKDNDNKPVFHQLNNNRYVADLEDDNESGSSGGGNADNKTIYERVEDSLNNSEETMETNIKNIEDGNITTEDMNKIADDLKFLQEQKQDISMSISDSIGDLSKPDLTDTEKQAILDHIKQCKELLEDIQTKESNILDYASAIDQNNLVKSQIDSLNSIIENADRSLNYSDAVITSADSAYNMYNSSYELNANQLQQLSDIQSSLLKGQSFHITISDAGTIHNTKMDSLKDVSYSVGR
jgi:hypothetical protein